MDSSQVAGSPSNIEHESSTSSHTQFWQDEQLIADSSSDKLTQDEDPVSQEKLVADSLQSFRETLSIVPATTFGSTQHDETLVKDASQAQMVSQTFISGETEEKQALAHDSSQGFNETLTTVPTMTLGSSQQYEMLVQDVSQGFNETQTIVQTLTMGGAEENHALTHDSSHKFSETLTVVPKMTLGSTHQDEMLVQDESQDLDETQTIVQTVTMCGTDASESLCIESQEFDIQPIEQRLTTPYTSHDDEVVSQDY